MMVGSHMICLQIVDTFYVMPISYEIYGIIDSTGEKWAKQMQGFLAQALHLKSNTKESCQKWSKESGYHLSIYIERKGGAFFRATKERKTDAFSKFMESFC